MTGAVVSMCTVCGLYDGLHLGTCLHYLGVRMVECPKGHTYVPAAPADRPNPRRA